MFTKVAHKNKIAFDSNKYVVALLNGFVEGLPLPDLYCKKEYDKAKNDLQNGLIYSDFELGAIGFLSTYAAKFYGGHHPKGKNGDDYVRRHINNIEKQLEEYLTGNRKKKLNFHTSDYLEAPVFENALIYLDPPYRGTTGYKGTDFDYKEFDEWAKMLAAQKGNTVILSEYTVPEGGKVLLERPIKTQLNNKVGSDINRVEKLIVI